jgi:hypothetical protein
MRKRMRRNEVPPPAAALAADLGQEYLPRYQLPRGRAGVGRQRRAPHLAISAYESRWDQFQESGQDPFTISRAVHSLRLPTAYFHLDTSRAGKGFVRASCGRNPQQALGSGHELRRENALGKSTEESYS